MFKKNKNINIVFTPTEMVLEEHYPQPAKNFLPDWYKKTVSYLNKDGLKIPTTSNLPDRTIKRCVPIFDSITAGYLIFSTLDIYVTQVNEKPYYSWKNPAIPYKISPISFHPVDQAPIYPKTYNDDIAKWKNPWGIKTPEGYSTLFIPPMHRESVFEILPAIVDTDTHNSQIQLPFI